VPDADSLAIDSGDLWRWVDRLTLPTRQRISRKPPGARKATVEYLDIPSLWTQLLADVQSTAAGGGQRAGGSGSRAPLNLEKVALAAEISDTVVDALRSYDLTPRSLVSTTTPRTALPAPVLVDHAGLPIHDPDLAGRLTERAARTLAAQRARHDVARFRHDTASDLRQLAVHVVGLAERDPINWWAERYRSWVARIETALGEDDEAVELRPVRGVACPACEQSYLEYERDGEIYRDPVLVVQIRDWLIQHATCRACGTGWWRGDELEQLGAHLGGTGGS